jgi:hypothetical protein
MFMKAVAIFIHLVIYFPQYGSKKFCDSIVSSTSLYFYCFVYIEEVTECDFVHHEQYYIFHIYVCFIM